MELALVILVIYTLCFAITPTLASSMSKPGCPQKCGNVTIPYPFGIGSKCSANSSFTVICKNSTGNMVPFLSNINLEVVKVSLCGAVIVNLPVSLMNCSEGRQTRESIPISLKGSPFTVSALDNTFLVLGCNTAVWFHDNGTLVGGCLAMCDDANATDVTSCNGINCCQTPIPRRGQGFEFTYQFIQPSNSSFCGYVFPVDTNWWDIEGYKKPKGLVDNLLNPFDSEFRFVPLVLEWEFGNQDGHCSSPDSNYGCPRSSYEYETYLGYSGSSSYQSSTKYCTCGGYEGNPYIRDGCIETYYSSNTNGYHNHDSGNTQAIKTAFTVIGSVVGVVIFLIAAWKFGKAITETFLAIKESRKYMFFKRNGGILLEQQLAAIEKGIEKTRLFTSAELAKATDDYNENRVLGRGGEGVVYKGMLEDGIIVAVKKSERVNQGDVVDFINEVVIVSQINHRNVVKLLGCCLESEVPRLVYEFIPNGTLFSHIHHPHEDFPLFWEMRVRIAKQVAGALAYLHSAASVPIYHRDIKSTNILLDEKYRAKISDFGTSRSISLDQTHVTTRVVGTFGYLDPEYFQSSQFTEKSDVYSFGVVLVELLTGEKAISAVRVEEGRGLAMHFLHSMEQDQLFHIVDARVLKEGKKEEIEAMAEIAKRCLHLNGKGRPTMKEVSHHLEGIKVEIPENQMQSSGPDPIEDVDSDGLSSISEIIECSSSDES
ncbi:wall-associated receptor kinase-like 1 [Salvia splendens]|uniref:wall-associated receptor kinase-like 1 n=1 Tax=Salvia splendens TaxID=180675 RepID=UPI001101E940|nr:wall-associated receptor kinase-like 1 [Salvia splendens]XP_042034657.1 wall-associated receptor kinase-like 1 [Salvia splendens]